MIKTLLLLILTIFIAGCSSSQIKSNNIKLTSNKKSVETIENQVDVFFEGQKIDSMTYTQFEALINGSAFYNELLEAEREGRVYVSLESNPWEVSLIGKKYCTHMNIIWKTKDGKVLKKTRLKVELRIPEGGKTMSNLRIEYRNVEEIGFPISTGLAILFFVLLFI